MAATQGHGNPDWTQDETLLALDLYLRRASSIPGPNDAEVVQLSEELRRLPVHPKSVRQTTFRNPAGVAFKLQNIRQVATGRGLSNASEIDRQVWEDFGGQPDRLRELVDAIRRNAKSVGWDEKRPLEAELHEDDEGVREGRLLMALHRRRERDKRLRKRLVDKRQALGGLRCDACGDLPKIDLPGLCDAGFEAHHLVPLAARVEGITRLNDLALLCAVCHRLLHRLMAARREWVGLEQLRHVLQTASSTRAVDAS